MVTPTNGFRTLTTTMRNNTGSICFKIRGLGVHDRSTGGFAATSLPGVATFYTRRNIGACLALGVVYCSRSVGRIRTALRTTGTTKMDTIVTSSVTIVACTQHVNLRIRVSARLGISG